MFVFLFDRLGAESQRRVANQTFQTVFTGKYEDI